MTDIAEKLYDVIGGRVGYYDIPKTMREAVHEIEQLRALNEKAARCLSVAYAALGTLAISGNHIASKAMEQMGEIADA